MELFTPDIGLLIWMLIPFLVVFFILAKFAWPAILKGVNKRSEYIEESLLLAEKARLELENVKIAGDEIIAKAKREQMAIIAKAEQTGNLLIDEAKQRAANEAKKIIEETRAQISHERDLALGDIRHQVAELSVKVAEKALLEKLDNSVEQEKMLNRLLDEMNINKS